MVLSDRRLIAENGQVIKCNCILWHTSPGSTLKIVKTNWACSLSFKRKIYET